MGLAGPAGGTKEEVGIESMHLRNWMHSVVSQVTVDQLVGEGTKQTVCIGNARKPAPAGDIEQVCHTVCCCSALQALHAAFLNWA
jgi:hypothetical protein